MASKVSALTAVLSENIADTDVVYIVDETAGTPVSKKMTVEELKKLLLPPGYINGLTLSNGSDAAHDIDVAVGRCRGADDDESIVLTAVMTKQIDATWAVGSDAGGLSSSLTAPANNTWYYVHGVIINALADVGFDTSKTAANLIADHSATAYRRIGAVRTDGSANILAFVQNDDEFLWKDPPLDVNTTTLSSTRTLAGPLTVPPGLVAIYNQMMSHASANVQVYVSPVDQNDEAPSITAAPLFSSMTQVAGQSAGGGPYRIRTDASGNIALRSNGSNTTYRLATLGWIDPRGRHS